MNILFFLAAFASEIIGTMAGFGSSTIFLHIFGNIGRISFFKKGLDKGLIIKFGIPSVILTVVGALLVSHISQDVLKGLLGIFLMGYSSYTLWKENFSVPASTLNA